MSYDRNRLFQSASDFFLHHGSAGMKLRPAAAFEVCEQAFKHGLLVVRVEGGIWHEPGFEARIDCIWDGLTPPIADREAEENNRRAAKFVQEEQFAHSAFIITTMALREKTL